ncbi:MAG: hypothetical protein HYV28_11515 [Ignavibacteriales bacterium]|nr:hypothetical protein [Ignavibacteriales bacterium]
MLTLEETAQRIKTGEKLVLAGDEALLSSLPAGNWIGGTIPYFMGDDGGLFTKQYILVDEVHEKACGVSLKFYDNATIEKIAADEFANGYTILIIPAFSKIHLAFAENSHAYPDIFNRPLVGWISGIDLADIGKVTPKVFSGLTGESSDTLAIAMHIELPENLHPVVDILNLFKQGDGDTITFEETGFQSDFCFINGQKTSLAKYISEKSIDTRMPLVADFYGAMINTSFQLVDETNDKVLFYAPVFKGIEYKIAAPVNDYMQEFTKELNTLQIQPVFSCNCILNYLYGELEGKKTGHITGPMTFGEIAYQLLNQTLVYLTVEED